MQNSFSDQCPSFRYLRVIIAIDLFGWSVILVSCGRDGVPRAVGIVLVLVLMAVVVAKAAIMMTMPMLNIQFACH